MFAERFFLIWTALCVSFIACLFMSRLGVKVNLVARASERGSHEGLVSTAGGLGVLIGIAITSELCRYLQLPIDNYLITALFFGLPLYMVCLVDDIFDLSALFRLLFQFGFSCFFLLSFFFGTPYFFLFILFFLFFLNASNFADGINGYLGFHTIFYLVVGIFFCSGESYGIGFFNFLLITLACFSSFLFFNVFLKSLFLGDVGSFFSGYIFVVLVLKFWGENLSVATCLIVSTMTIWVDVIITLIYRLVNGKNIMQAHSEHVYQLLTRNLLEGSHIKSCALICMINFSMSIPIIYSVTSGFISNLFAIIFGVIYTGAILVFIRRRAITSEVSRKT